MTPDDRELAALEQRLTEARAELQAVPTRDLRPQIRAAIQRRGDRQGFSMRGRLSRGAALGLAAALLIGGTVAAALGVHYLFISRVPGPGVPIDTGVPVGSGWDFGDLVSFADAQAATNNQKWVIKPQILGEPDRVHLRHVDNIVLVTLEYDGRPGLPAATQGGPGAMLVEIGGLFEDQTLHKMVPEDGTVEEVDLGSVTGHWISGTWHLFAIDDEGQLLLYQVAGETLVWEMRGATYRLETRAGKAATVSLGREIVAQLRATPP